MATPFRYLISPVTCVKGGVKVKVTFALFFVKVHIWPRARFSKAPETFRVRKAIAKSQTLRLQSCLIHIFLMGTEILFIQGVSAVYTSSFLDTDELKIALRARKGSGTFEKRAIVLCPWLQYTFRAPLQVSRVKSLSPYIKLKLIELAIKLYQEFWNEMNCRILHDLKM